MKQDNTDRMFDKRVVRRNISTGRIQSEDYDQFLTALPDVTENIKPSTEGGDNDGYDQDAQDSQEPEESQEGQQPAGILPSEAAPVAAAEPPPGEPVAGFGAPAPVGTEPPTGA